LDKGGFLRKAIVLLSGGVDSTVALAEALAQGLDGSCLVFNYQQAAWIRELEAASAVANHYGIALSQCHIDGHFWRGASFLTGGSINPMESYVPARNLLLLAHGIAAAEAAGAGQVWFGANADDAEFYPDCRQTFVDALNAVSGTKRPVRVVAPHLGRTKLGVLRLGVYLNAPLGITMSCASGTGCGVCRGCRLDAEARSKLP
jgi:7-cyano-7-deazaguanine synthase